MKNYECYKCKQNKPVNQGWLSRKGFLCDTCQRRDEIFALQNKGIRKVTAMVTDCSHPEAFPQGMPLCIEYSNRDTVAIVYKVTGEQVGWAERVDVDSQAWRIETDVECPFFIDIREVKYGKD